MIGVKIQGRLGNQMFQYAFGLSLSKKLKTSVYYDWCDAPVVIHRYFEYPLRPQWLLKKIVAIKKLMCGKAFDRIVTIDNDRFYPLSKGADIEASHNAYYDGYFQSVNYFCKQQESVKEKFRIKSRYTGEFDRKYGRAYLENKIIAVHVRKTDYLTHGNESLGGADLSLPVLYYEKAFQLIENISAYKIIFVGDDLAEVRKRFGNMGNALFETNAEIIDFQIIQNADVAIISNSTFSWWAAYLNRKENKKIYAPKYWMGYRVRKDYPICIYDKLPWHMVDLESAKQGS